MTEYRPPREARVDSIGHEICYFFYQNEWQPSPAWIAELAAHERETRDESQLGEFDRYTGPENLPGQIMREAVSDVEKLCVATEGYLSGEAFLNYRDPQRTQELVKQHKHLRRCLVQRAVDSMHWLLADQPNTHRWKFTFAECCDLSEVSDVDHMRENLIKVVSAWLSRRPIAVALIRKFTELEESETEDGRMLMATAI